MRFRKVFNDFDPTLVANLDEERLLSIRLHGSPLLSDPKLRAIIHNAKQLLKVRAVIEVVNLFLNLKSTDTLAQ